MFAQQAEATLPSGTIYCHPIPIRHHLNLHRNCWRLYFALLIGELWVAALLFAMIDSPMAVMFVLELH
jgi:hypothetical protein